MKYYAGVGSREIPPEIHNHFRDLAMYLAELGYRLRSGHADGADWAFELGASGKADIYLPWPSFGQKEPDNRPVLGTKYNKPEDWTEAIAANYHPNWKFLKYGARKLHMRNVHQVLGDSQHPKPSQFVVCWTKDATGTGGTGQAIRIANGHSIPVFDYGNTVAESQLQVFLEAVLNKPIALQGIYAKQPIS